MAKKIKFYTVWEGRVPGVYHTWAEAEAQIKGVAAAKYKSFETLKEAQAAYAQKPAMHLYKKANEASQQSQVFNGKPIMESISVDAACSGNPGVLEYQGVETATKRQIFRMGPFPEGTVNLGEFLAIVHGLAILKKHDSPLPLYSDSKTAIAWVRNKAIKTTLPRNKKNAELFALVDRAIIWLQSNSYTTKVLKWETEHWGENPADFGRK